MKQYNIRIIPAAYDDIKETRAWYRTKNPKLPHRFNKQLKITMQQIRSLPAVHAIRYADVRIANMAVFPYAVHYIIESDSIIVLAVYHSAINPDKWRRRL